MEILLLLQLQSLCQIVPAGGMPTSIKSNLVFYLTIRIMLKHLESMPLQINLMKEISYEDETYEGDC
jgi:hypothetical protein